MLRCARMTAMTGRTAALVWHGQWQQWADSDRCCAIHISTLRADCGLSLRPQTKLGNLKKADTRGRDPVFSMCKCCERQL